MKLTPMFQQYLRAKEQHPDALLFFRLGDFYELFFEDAERAASLLDLTLTSRSKKDEERVPMCGVPHHSARPYFARLLAAGVKVAICEQTEDPAEAKGLVAREVVRVLTPGTVTEEDCLDPHRPNYLAALDRDGEGYALALAELSTGETVLVSAAGDDRLADEFARFAPAEILVPDGDAVLERLAAATGGLVSRLDPERFRAPGGEAERVFRALRWYLEQTHRASLEHLRAPSREAAAERLVIDETSQRNLELLQTSRGERRGSLLWVLDQCRAPMGSRLLRSWMLAPLVDLAEIGRRLDAVEALLARPSWRDELRQQLGAVGDLERLVGRLASARVGPRDLLALAAALERVESIRSLLAESADGLLGECAAALDPLPEARQLIERGIEDDPPAGARAGGVIRAGYDADVDELRRLAHSGKSGISELEAAERRRTGIASLKVRYNQVFGYYIEVTKANLHLVPEDFRRKQTLAGAERFVTPALEEFERRVLGAEDRLHALESRLFDDLVQRLAAHQGALAATAAALARIDVLATLATVAEKRRYARPRLVQRHGIDIRDGRHPVIEAVLDSGTFVPNDCRLDPEGPQLAVLTGPNMAGKSTYLRQAALIVLLAQMGSFVPAAEAEIGVVDRLFTRVGAADNLAGGESTFMVEMRETAHILDHLTARSLVVLDEIGRGTSTFDGISIAWAVAEFLHDHPVVRPLVLFATHYHELTDLARTLPRVANASVAVREWKGEVIFLRRIVPEPASRSYGIEVAKLAGVPPEVIDRAREILRNLESGELTEAGQPRLARHGRDDAGQLSLFSAAADPLRGELAGLDVDRMTPLDALTKLSELAARARR
jgi:DNA mismatch repair protein MutS